MNIMNCKKIISTLLSVVMIGASFVTASAVGTKHNPELKVITKATGIDADGYIELSVYVESESFVAITTASKKDSGVGLKDITYNFDLNGEFFKEDSEPYLEQTDAYYNPKSWTSSAGFKKGYLAVGMTAGSAVKSYYTDGSAPLFICAVEPAAGKTFTDADLETINANLGTYGWVQATMSEQDKSVEAWYAVIDTQAPTIGDYNFASLVAGTPAPAVEVTAVEVSASKTTVAATDEDDARKVQISKNVTGSGEGYDAVEWTVEPAGYGTWDASTLTYTAPAAPKASEGDKTVKITATSTVEGFTDKTGFVEITVAAKAAAAADKKVTALNVTPAADVVIANNETNRDVVFSATVDGTDGTDVDGNVDDALLKTVTWEVSANGADYWTESTKTFSAPEAPAYGSGDLVFTVTATSDDDATFTKSITITVKEAEEVIVPDPDALEWLKKATKSPVDNTIYWGVKMNGEADLVTATFENGGDQKVWQIDGIDVSGNGSAEFGIYITLTGDRINNATKLTLAADDFSIVDEAEAIWAAN